MSKIECYLFISLTTVFQVDNEYLGSRNTIQYEKKVGGKTELNKVLLDFKSH